MPIARQQGGTRLCQTLLVVPRNSHLYLMMAEAYASRKQAKHRKGFLTQTTGPYPSH